MSYPEKIARRNMYIFNVEDLMSAIKADGREKVLESPYMQEIVSYLQESEYKSVANSGNQALSRAFIKAGVPIGNLGAIMDEGERYSEECLRVSEGDFFPKSSVIYNWLAAHLARTGTSKTKSETLKDAEKRIKAVLEDKYTGKRGQLIKVYLEYESQMDSETEGNEPEIIDLVGEAEPVEDTSVSNIPEKLVLEQLNLKLF